MTAIDIAAMAVTEKLKLMEALWESLSNGTERDFKSPTWHEKALKQAENELAAGTAHFVDWAEAKDGLRRNSRA